jgi:curli biogenesis system outer membrane secretion channel CsgG
MKYCLLIFTAFFFLVNCQSGPTPKKEADSVELRDVEVPARGEEESPRHRVLVLPFLDEKPERSKKVSEAARQAMVRELTRTRQFVVVALEDFPQDPKKFLTTDQEYDLAAVARIASTIGVAAVIEGKVMDVRARSAGDSIGLVRRSRAQVDTSTRLRVFAGKNGKEILNEVRTASEEATSTHYGENGGSPAEDPELIKLSVRKAILGGMPNLVRAIEKLNWEGRVAMISGEKVYVNAGRLSGIQVGDILKITEEGEDVFDPQNGKFIGTAPGRMKGTVEIVSYFGKDGAISVIHSGSGFKENDRVELY